MPFKRIKGFVGGQRPKQSTETVAKLRQTINQFTLNVRSLQRQAGEQRDLAKQLLRDGNKAGASQALKRRAVYMNQLNSTHSKIANLRRVVDSIKAAEDNVTMTRVLRDADRAIQVSLSEAGPEAIEEVMMGLEESIEGVAYVDESLSSSEISDIGMEEEFDLLDNQLADLEAEIAGEVPGARTAPVEGTPVEELPPASTTPTVAKEEDKEIQDEVARLKKELERELGR